jgi:uroporphyrinogen-III synthase
MNRVWITRTQPAADESAQLWRAAGFDPLVEPLLDVQSVAHEDLSQVTCLIFTSKNAIEHVTCQGQRAICVGDATAEKARAAGFTDVVSVDGTSAEITAWVKANLPTSQALCHVSGWHVRGSIAEDLQAAGYAADRVKVYRSIPRPIWPEVPMSFAALYSPLAAATFAEVAVNREPSSLSAVCISQATADELSGLTLKAVHIAARPREDELIMAAKDA